MTINLTPDIQSQMYMDKKDGYLLNMVDKLTPKIDYQPNEKKDDDKKSDNSQNDNNEKKEPSFKDSTFTFNSYMNDKNLNSSISSTQGFFDTLSSAGGNVTEAS